MTGWDWRARRRVRRDRSECKRRQAANGSAPALRAMCTHRSTTLDEIKTRPTRPAHRPIRSNRRHRLLAAFRKRAGLACESAKVCVDVQSIPRRGIRMQSAPASPTTPPETCRRCRRSFPRNSLQSCAMGPRPVAARVVSAEAGGAIEPPRPTQASETARPLR